MQVISGSAAIPTNAGPCAVGIGIFDGVHLGHRALLANVLTVAQQQGVRALAYTFHPHPAAVLSPERAPQLLEPIEVRLQRLEALGLDAVLVEPFSRDFARMDAEAFVRDVLMARLSVRHVAVGANFRFGARATGDLALLTRMGHEHGFSVTGLSLEAAGDEVVTSTRVRALVTAGDMQGAAALLTRPYCVFGVVERGAGRGAGLGFATANVRPDNGCLPGRGVYVARLRSQSLEHAAPAVVNVGTTPTFDTDGRSKIEAHLLDYHGGPLYGARVELDLLARLRDEQRFSSAQELVRQIGLDVAAARRHLDSAP